MKDRHKKQGPGAAAEEAEALGPFSFTQPPGGQRLTGDTLLLSDFALPLAAPDRVIDLGTAAGAIPLIFAWKSPAGHIVGVEVMEGPAEQARKNVEANALAGRVDIIEADWRDLPGRFPRGSFDVVVANPPYRSAASTRVSPDKVRAAARSELYGTLGDLVEVTEYLLAPSGRACFVFIVDRKAEMLRELEARGLVPARLKYVHPAGDEPARLFLVECRRKDEGEGT